MLIDLNLISPSADLLLDLAIERSWADLAPVADELTQRHLELAAATSSHGLMFLAAPAHLPTTAQLECIPRLLQSLAGHFTWVVLDLGLRTGRLAELCLAATDTLLLIMTADPPALRGGHRLCASLPAHLLGRTGLVINQYTKFHPAQPESIARSLGCPLMACLPRESRLVADQVNFGRPVVLEDRSLFSFQIHRLADQVASAGVRLDALVPEHGVRDGR